MAATLPCTPPYAWGAVYMAASHMEEHLPGIPLSPELTVQQTEEGILILDQADQTVARVIIRSAAEDGHMLKARDRVLVSTQDGIESGELVCGESASPLCWRVQLLGKEVLVPLSHLTFDNVHGRERWANAVRLAPYIAKSRASNWLGICTLKPESASATVSIGDPVGLRRIPSRPDLDGVGGVLLARKSPGSWVVRVQRLTAATEELTVSDESACALPNWPFLGVSLACLRAFEAQFELQLASASTEDACERVVKPLTEGANASLAACLARVGASDEAGFPFVSKPTCFVSHARKYPFTDLIAAIEAHAAEQPGPIYVWVDIFSQCQHWIGEVGSVERVCNWDVVFQLTIRAIGQTCLVLSPWRAPLPLERAWILWEILCTQAAKAELHVHVPPSEAKSLEAALLNEFDSIMASISRVDSRAATCWTVDDERMIHSAIESGPGHKQMNEVVVTELRKWVARAGEKALAQLAPADRGTSLLINQLVFVLVNEGRVDEAVKLGREAVEAKQERLGASDNESIKAVANLAIALREQSRRNEAAVLLLERQVGKAAEVEQLVVKSRAALKEAEQLARGAVESWAGTRGRGDPATLAPMGTLANVLTDQGKLDEAEPLLREARASWLEARGPRDQDYLRCLGNLSKLLQQQGKFAEAEPLLHEALEAKREVKGPRHQEYLGDLNNLAGLYASLGKFAQAEPLMRKALEAHREVLGPRHPTTLTFVNNLAFVLEELGRKDEADQLEREVGLQ